MVLPIWAIFGLISAVLSATMMLLQERFKIEGFVQAYWNKITCALVTLPFVLIHGLPRNPYFYFFLAIGAVMYAISDVVFYRSIARVGAGIVARLLPGAMILSFLLWFVVKPALIGKYLAAPTVAAGIFVVLCASAWFASHIKKCDVSMRAVRTIWFVIFAATVGPVLAKTVTSFADIDRGPAGYIFAEALMMLTIWTVFFIIRRPVSAGVLFSPKIIPRAMTIGAITAAMVASNIYAYYHVDNPAYIPAIKYLDSIIILGVYALTGRKGNGNIWSGLGVVACAALLIILKAQI